MKIIYVTSIRRNDGPYQPRVVYVSKISIEAMNRLIALGYTVYIK